MWSQICNINTIQYKVTEQLHHLQNNYLECIKTEKNDSKFTLGKYHINAVKIINIF